MEVELGTIIQRRQRGGAKREKEWGLQCREVIRFNVLLLD